MSYGTKAWDIVGYTYHAENVCPDCMFDTAKAKALALGSATMWGDNYGRVEEVVGEWASLEGIDRMDESSYDSDEFPKVIFSSSVEDDEHCECGHVLGGDYDDYWS